jgi:hypothetical protein
MRKLEGLNKLYSCMGFITFAQFLRALGLRVLETSGWSK